MCVQYPPDGRSMRVPAIPDAGPFVGQPGGAPTPATAKHRMAPEAPRRSSGTGGGDEEQIMDRAVAREQPGDRGVVGRSDAPTPSATGGPAAKGSAEGGPERRARGERLRIRIPAAVDRLPPLRRRVEHWAQAHELTAAELSDLQLALGEAVSNAMEHAYAEAGTGTVDVELEVRANGPGREIAVRVTDRGTWKPATSRPTDRGRGIAMIDELSGDMRVTSNRSGTEVVFTVPLAGH
jgi:serine/threonine-protein kinase RsbW